MNSLWIAKFTITEFLKRLYSGVWKRSYEIGLQIIRWFLIVTFIGVVIATLSECTPFSHYWQVNPDPGPHCRQGYAQLITMGVSDSITDLVLVGFPIPIVIASSMPVKRSVLLASNFEFRFTDILAEKYLSPSFSAFLSFLLASPSTEFSQPSSVTPTNNSVHSSPPSKFLPPQL